MEKENSTVWKAVTLTLKSRDLPISHWQDVLPDVLHSVRSLLCTATNETPHDRFFNHPRRAASGASLPTWLCQPGPVLLRKHERNKKSDPLVERQIYNLLFEKFFLVNFTRRIRMSDEFRLMNSLDNLIRVRIYY